MNSSQITVDARNMPCPMPLLKLKQALNQIEKGDTVFLMATDPTSKRDFFSFAKIADHVINLQEESHEFHYYVTKG